MSTVKNVAPAAAEAFADDVPPVRAGVVIGGAVGLGGPEPSSSLAAGRIVVTGAHHSGGGPAPKIGSGHGGGGVGRSDRVREWDGLIEMDTERVVCRASGSAQPAPAAITANGVHRSAWGSMYGRCGPYLAVHCALDSRAQVNPVELPVVGVVVVVSHHGGAMAVGDRLRLVPGTRSKSTVGHCSTAARFASAAAPRTNGNT
jgi:hypothetical protein